MWQLLTVWYRDILLLEVGFLSILIAPVVWFPVSRERWFRQHDNVTMWLVKWLLFRLMFSSCVVKLNSGCPTWWGLTGMFSCKVTWTFIVMCVQFSSILVAACIIAYQRTHLPYIGTDSGPCRLTLTSLTIYKEVLKQKFLPAGFHHHKGSEGTISCHDYIMLIAWKYSLCYV